MDLNDCSRTFGFWLLIFEEKFQGEKRRNLVFLDASLMARISVLCKSLVPL